MTRKTLKLKMIKRIIVKLIMVYCLFLLCASINLQAQNTANATDSIYRVETTDGNIFMGPILEQDEQGIVIKTETLGEVKIKREKILRMSLIEQSQMVQGTYWPENTQDARYFWAPNGYGLKKDEGYYQNIWVLFNQVSYGFSDYFSVGAGMMPLFLFGGTSTPFWFTPKFSFPISKEKVNLGIGTLFASVLGEDGGGVGLLYGTLTLGNRNHNASFGLAYGYTTDEVGSVPVINIAGITRVGPKSYLMTENYFFTADSETVGIISIGGRQMVRSVGLDYGLLMPFGDEIDTFVAIPWLGLSIPFGKK